jgi:hypothetical protein
MIIIPWDMKKVIIIDLCDGGSSLLHNDGNPVATLCIIIS